MNHKWTCLSYFSKSGDSFMLICAQFSSHSLFEGQCGRTLVWALFFHQYKQRQQVPDGTQPWPHHFYTLSHWLMASGSGTLVMLKEFTLVWIFLGFDSCQVLQQSQVISIYQARTRSGFRKTKVMNYWAFSSLAVIHLDIFIFQAVLQKIKDL